MSSLNSLPSNLITLDRLLGAFSGELPRIVSDAVIFTVRAHGEQVRKFTGEAYVNHPIEAAAILKELVPEASDELVAALVLHDVVEDTDVDLFEIVERFGSTVGRHVQGLTAVSVNKGLQNRKARTDHEAWRLSACSPEVQTAKACDIISNTRSVPESGRSFAVKYLSEKVYVLECMRDIDPRVRRVAERSVEDSMVSLTSDDAIAPPGR